VKANRDDELIELLVRHGEDRVDCEPFGDQAIHGRKVDLISGLGGEHQTHEHSISTLLDDGEMKEEGDGEEEEEGERRTREGRRGEEGGMRRWCRGRKIESKSG